MSLDSNLGFSDTSEDHPVPLRKCRHRDVFWWSTSKGWCSGCKRWVRSVW